MSENYPFDEESHGDMGFDTYDNDADDDDNIDPDSLIYNPESGDYESHQEYRNKTK